MNTQLCDDDCRILCHMSSTESITHCQRIENIKVAVTSSSLSQHNHAGKARSNQRETHYKNQIITF